MPKATPGTSISMVATWIWLAVCALEVTFAFVPPEGVFHRIELPPSARLLALCPNLALSASVLGAGAALMFCLSRSLRLHPRGIARGRVLGAASRITALAIASLVAFGFLGSWATLHQSGAFPGPTGYRFGSESLVLLARHVAQQSPLLFLGVPVASIALGAGATEGLPRLAGAALPRLRRASIAAALGLFSVVTAGSAFGSFVASRSAETTVLPGTGVTTTRGEAFVAARDDHGGPLVHLIAEWRRDEDLRLTSFEPHPELIVERPRIVTVDEWASLVAPAKHHRYNVIILLVESLRADQLTALGSDRVVMPTVESIASGGRVFSRAYTQASHSDLADPCPLASQYPLRGPYGSAAYRRNAPYPRTLLYDLLKARGWRTAIMSSQNETWGAMLTYLDTGTLDRILHSETFDGPTYVPRGDSTFVEFVKGTKRAGKIDDRLTVGEAIEWIDERRDAPFFIYMNLQNSHIPYEVPSDFPRRFTTAGTTVRTTFARIDREQVETAKNLYAEALGYVDHQVGRLVSHLKVRDLWDETIFVISGDTGQAFMEHGFLAHARDLYDEVMRVPIVIHAPGLARGVDSRLAEHVDVPPTVLDLLGLPLHPSFQGRSLIAAQSPHDSAYLLVRTPFAHQYGVIHEGHKLIVDRRAGRALLYDLDADPEERREISRARPHLTRELTARLFTWMRAHLEYYADPLRMKSEYPPIVRERG
jgi:arylsulfatase A-like enzyme